MNVNQEYSELYINTKFFCVFLFCLIIFVSQSISMHTVKQPWRHPACLNVYHFAASTFFLTPVFFICDVFNGREVIKQTNWTDRQPRRFIYPKDGGRFDAPKMHVFTHLLRKCFTGKSKVRLRPPKSTIYGGSKWPLFTPKTAWIKIA